MRGEQLRPHPHDRPGLHPADRIAVEIPLIARSTPAPGIWPVPDQLPRWGGALQALAELPVLLARTRHHRDEAATGAAIFPFELIDETLAAPVIRKTPRSSARFTRRTLATRRSRRSCCQIRMIRHSLERIIRSTRRSRARFAVNLAVQNSMFASGILP